MLVAKEDLVSVDNLISRHINNPSDLTASVRWPVKGVHFGKVYLVKIAKDKSGNNAVRDVDGRVKVFCPNTKHKFFIAEADIHFEEA